MTAAGIRGAGNPSASVKKEQGTGIELHFRPGMGENEGVAPVQPRASGARPHRIEMVRFPYA